MKGSRIKTRLVLYVAQADEIPESWFDDIVDPVPLDDPIPLGNRDAAIDDLEDAYYLHYELE